YLTGVGRSPINTSPASWNRPRTAARSGFARPWNIRLRITPKAWAIIATRRLCSWMFSGYVLCIRPHRLMNFMRDRYAKKWLIQQASSRTREILDAGNHLGHHRRMRIVGPVGLAVVLLLPALGAAQVYRWAGAGALHFTNPYDRCPEPPPPQGGPPLPVAPDKSEPAAPSPVPSSSAITRIPYTPGSPILVSAT